MARRTGAVEFIGYSGNSNVEVMEEGHGMDRDREGSNAKKAWKEVKIKAKLFRQGVMRLLRRTIGVGWD